MEVIEKPEKYSRDDCKRLEWLKSRENTNRSTTYEENVKQGDEKSDMCKTGIIRELAMGGFQETLI